MGFLNAVNVVENRTGCEDHSQNQNCKKINKLALLYGMRKGKKLGLLTNIYILRNKGNNMEKE